MNAVYYDCALKLVVH